MREIRFAMTVQSHCKVLVTSLVNSVNSISTDDERIRPDMVAFSVSHDATVGHRRWHLGHLGGTLRSLRGTGGQPHSHR